MKKWEIKIGEKIYRADSTEKTIKYIKAGKIPKDALVKSGNEKNWKPIGKIIEFEKFFTTGLSLEGEKEEPKKKEIKKDVKVCPKCNYETPTSAEYCSICKYSFIKDKNRKESIDIPKRRIKAERKISANVLKKSWMQCLLAFFISFFITPKLRIIWYPFRFIKVFWHEIGHTVLYWLFGYFAIPAVDPLSTGGVSLAVSSNSAVPFFIIGILIVGTYLIRKYDYGIYLGTGITVFYGILAFTPAGDWLIWAGGILAEYILIGVSLYFCLFKRRFKVKGERFLYGLLGWISFRERLQFLFKLKTSEIFYKNYIHGQGWQKGLIGDLARISFDINHKFSVDSFDTIVNIFIALIFVPLIILAYISVRRFK